jgi:hypothetical protein
MFNRRLLFEIFSRNYIWRRLTADITIEFIEVAVDRMFNADEVCSVVALGKLKELKHRIVNLFRSCRRRRRRTGSGSITGMGGSA